MHARGRGTSTNCTKAARLFLVFLEEQSGWTQDSDAAMQALDDKDDWGALVLPPSPSLPLFPPVRFLSARTLPLLSLCSARNVMCYDSSGVGTQRAVLVRQSS